MPILFRWNFGPFQVDGVYRLKIISIKDILKGAIFLEPVLKSFYLKRIRAKKLTLGEEITFDYDSELQEGLVGTKCRCGSNNCRGFIGVCVYYRMNLLFFHRFSLFILK